MMPNSKGFINRFKVVKIPTVKSLFLRSGYVPPVEQSVDIEKLGGVLPMRKTDTVAMIEELADQVPVAEPEGTQE